MGALSVRVCVCVGYAPVCARVWVFLLLGVSPREFEQRARVLCSTQADSGARSVSS